jgi:hypothetical protein
MFPSWMYSGHKNYIESPDGNIKLYVIPSPAKSSPYEFIYSVTAFGKPVLNQSSLRLSSPHLNFENLHLTGVEKNMHNGNWTDNSGPKKDIPDNYNEATIF